MLQQLQTFSPNTLDWMGNKTTATFLGTMIGLIGIGLGYPGQPHVLNRYMAAKDSKTISRGTWIAFCWGFIIYLSAILLGISGNALIPDLEDPEHLFLRAADMLLPTFLTAVILTGILAAIMSTVSAQIIVAASAVSHDVYSKMLRRQLLRSRRLEGRGPRLPEMFQLPRGPMES